MVKLARRLHCSARISLILASQTVASHLTVTSKAPTGASTTRAFNAQGAEAANGADGAFASLLGGTESTSEGKATAGSKLESALNKLAGLVLDGTQPGDADTDAQDPEAVAAVIDATLPITAQIDAKAMFTGLVNDLATLKQSLASGEPVDPELLKRIDNALEGLSAELDIDLSALATPSLADLAGLAQGTEEGDPSTTARLAQALAPLAETLLGGAAAAADTPVTADAAQLLQSIGDKLAKLAQALKSDAIGTGDLASLNLASDSTADADLAAAISKLLSAPAAAEAPVVGPALGAAKLSLADTTLTGKPADAAVNTTSTTDTADSTSQAPVLSVDAKTGSDADTATGGDAKPKDESDKTQADPKANAAAAATVNEIRDDTQGVGQHPAQAARTEAVAPRVIQAGYQTSQQQLNLPQLAFELVRQVNDGNTRFQMRLDPPELGRIDVKLDIDKSGQINARLVVEKSETLDLMQRDQRALERALQQAGLDASKTNLEFSLKQNPFSSGQQQGRDDSGQQFSLNSGGLDDIEEPPPTVNLYRASLTASGVNIIA